ncbi:MAG: PRC-barrel domain-containing protein [Rhodocyclaceae bacterium]|jgi:sporulation protein YlmC with PRC-barrel domain
MKMFNKTTAAGILALSLTLGMGAATAQTAGTVNLGTSKIDAVLAGWSAKKTLLGTTVYNDTGEKVGKITDLIVAPDASVTYAIVGAGGFVGIGRHDVAVSVQHFSLKDNKLVLAGATKDAIKALPPFEYAKKPKS